LNVSFERIEAMFAGTGSPVQRKMRYGNAAEEIIKETESEEYDLVAVGVSGKTRPFPVFRAGSTTKKLARTLTMPLVIARSVPEKISKILICTGGETQSLENIRTAGRFLACIPAEIQLLHVMSQLALRLDSPDQDLLDTAESAIARGTREGRHFIQAMEILRKAGIPETITPKLRHGLVIDEVIKELNEGHYDLMVIGSHYHQAKKPLLEILLEDIAGQLIGRASCSVMLV
jgi:nucleotide-binding universal stress UspA family protein